MLKLQRWEMEEARVEVVIESSMAMARVQGRNIVRSCRFWGS